MTNKEHTPNEHGSTYQTMNYSQNFIDPSIVAHTQSTEIVWRVTKKKYDIKENGASPLVEKQLKVERFISSIQGHNI